MNKQVFTSIGRAVKKHCPEILMGMGIAGMMTTTILAVAATPKAMKLIEAKKREQQTEKLRPIETVKTAWHCYLPSAVTMIASVGCLIGAETLNAQKGAALAAAYALSETARKEYGNKVTELFGQKKEQEVKDAIAKDKIDRQPVKTSEVIFTGCGDTLCYDVLSGRYFKSDIEKLRQAENALNAQMLNEMYVSLNEWYYAIGLSEIRLGDALGWDVHKGLLHLTFSSQLTEEGTPCMVVGYQEPPYYVSWLSD